MGCECSRSMATGHGSRSTTRWPMGASSRSKPRFRSSGPTRSKTGSPPARGYGCGGCSDARTQSSPRVPVSTSWLPAVRVSEAMGEESSERRTGGIVRRGVERQIEDRKLLERPQLPPEFLESDPWRVLRIQAEFVAGFDALATLGPAVTFFGSARVRPPDPMYDAART